MRTWWFNVEIRGQDGIHFFDGSINVSEKVFHKTMRELKKGIPFQNCKYYDYLTKKLDKALTVDKYIEYEEERPQRSMYDTREEYLLAVSDYESCKEAFYDRYTIWDYALNNPYKETQGVAKVIGIQLSGYEEGNYEFEFDVSSSWNCQTRYYRVEVVTDDQGKIIDLGTVECSVETYTDTRCEFEYIDPDYDEIADYLTSL